MRSQIVGAIALIGSMVISAILLHIARSMWPVLAFGWFVLLPLGCLIEWWRHG